MSEFVWWGYYSKNIFLVEIRYINRFIILIILLRQPIYLRGCFIVRFLSVNVQEIAHKRAAPWTLQLFVVRYPLPSNISANFRQERLWSKFLSRSSQSADYAVTLPLPSTAFLTCLLKRMCWSRLPSWTLREMKLRKMMKCLQGKVISNETWYPIRAHCGKMQLAAKKTKTIQASLSNGPERIN